MGPRPVALALLLTGCLLKAATGHAHSATDVCPNPTTNPCELSGTLNASAGSILDFGSRTFVMKKGSRINVLAPPEGQARTLTIFAGTVTIQEGALISGAGATVSIQADGNITLVRVGSSRSRIEVHPAGVIDLLAGGHLVVDGDLIARTTTTDGDGGALTGIAGGDVRISGNLQLYGGQLFGFGGSVLLQAGGSLVIDAPSAQIVDTSGGANGGDIELNSGAGMTITAKLDASAPATSTSGDGGFVTLTSGGDLLLAGQVNVSGAGCEGADCVGGFGGEATIDAGGTLRIQNVIDMSGAPPDGEGGTLDVIAGVDILQSARISLHGRGVFASGGSVFLVARRLVSLSQLLQVNGSDTGGFVLVQADEEIRANGEIHADGTTGLIQLSTLVSTPAGERVGGPVTVGASGFLHARAGTGRSGGAIDVQGCNVTVEPTGRIITQGTGGENILAASELLRVRGTLTAAAANRLRYRDAAIPPNTAGASISPAATQVHVPELPACRGPVIPVCGDGVREGGETCDDGNLTSGDGCDANCTPTGCGNGIITAGEECDDGNATSGDGCDANCTFTRCGNGIMTAGEECDDGNTAPGDGCDGQCRIEIPPGCGNGVLDAGEQCDDGNNVSCDGCSKTCFREECGNGIVDCPGVRETCDDFNTDPCDGCSPACREEECGNGILDCNEECDEGAANGTPGAGCDTSCRIAALCSEGGSRDCVPCAAHTDCSPAGLCAGRGCVAGVCTQTPALDCASTDPCTIGGCDPLLGCTTSPAADGTSCADGSVCNGSETCRGGVCAAGTALACEDGDACTDDACDPQGGCQNPRRTGFAGIACQLENFETRLAAAVSVTPGFRTKLGKAIGRIRAKLDKAAAAESNPKKAGKLLKAAEKQLKKLGKVLAKGARKKKPQVSPEDVPALTAALTDASSAAAAVRAALSR